jgi:N-acetylneuraminic acid mutarotase
VYVIGGEIGRAPSSEVLVYDPRRDAWREAASKPTPAMNAGAAVIGNMLYVPGGATADSQATDRVEALNLTTGEWKVLPPLPLPLAGHAVVAFGDRLYVVGGRTLSGLNTTTLAFDVKSGRWTSLAPLPTPRSQLGAAVVNGRIYAVGGYDGRREYATCEYFQIATGEWAVCAPMTIPRGGLGLAQVGSTLFAVGGGLSGFIGFNERYDPNADKWTPFEMPEQRMGDWRYVGIASLSTEFYAIGGSTRSVPLADNYVYEVLNNRTFLPAFQSNKDQ